MSEPFDQALSATQHAAITDFSAASQSLLAAFGGINARLGMPPFEFFRLAAEISIKKMFLRDVEQAWYQRGLPGISHDVPGTARYLAAEIAHLNVRHTVFVGNSMGGYAAILFGCLLEVDVVHAFSPQTFFSRLSRLMVLDVRWSRQMRRLHRTKGLSREYFDLKPLLMDAPRQTVIHLHYADQHRLDRIHCRRIQGIPNVVLHPYPHASHSLIKRLRESGALKDILCQSLVGSTSRAA